MKEIQLDWTTEDGYSDPDSITSLKNAKIVHLAYYYTDNYNMNRSHFEMIMASICISTTLEELNSINFN